jgi:hypothetical protein
MTAGDGSNSRKVHNYTPWVNVVCGLLVFILRYSAPRGTFSVHWNLIWTGLIIIFASLATTIAHDENSPRNYWSAINVAAGAWLIVSAKTIPSIERVAVGQVTLGAIVIVLGLVSLATEFVSRSAKPSGL